MATKKKAEAGRDKAAPDSGGSRPALRSEGYEAALRDYVSALELLHKGNPTAALERFVAIEAANPDEPELGERMRAYATICRRKLASEPATPTSADGLYEAAVIFANRGELDRALDYLTKALELDTGSARVLYARASVFALRGQPDSAVVDLKKAVAREPLLRFQASNDPDFERIRDEAGFIDVIEPTPAGA
jgi:tetratricopeptide (TPR) repeat protein